MKRILNRFFIMAVAVCAVACKSDEINDEQILEGGSPVSGEYCGHEYVDLGLSVKWATCNVGADELWDTGCFYAWGETQTKESYMIKNYEYNGPDDLPAENDAACVIWGGGWRTPTETEIQELLKNCNFKCTQYPKTDVWGYKVSSKVSGFGKKYIFLPFTGHMDEKTLLDAGKGGYYWSSTAENKFAKALMVFYPSTVEIRKTYSHNGFVVRPVFE